MLQSRYLHSAIIGLSALLFTGAQFTRGQDAQTPILANTLQWLNAKATVPDSGVATRKPAMLATMTRRAIDALASVVGPLSSPKALEDAFRSYFAFKTEHPDEVRNPYLYFVDYGLPSTARRGYVFDMSALRILDGPFTVAHGRGSSASRYGVPTRFSNTQGSAATSLGLYLTGETYPFSGASAGRSYSSVGLRLLGVSGDYNDNALARRVVAHGAPYVTPTSAGRSEGCPAMEQSRARRLLPKLANGGMVFLFAPDSNWLAGDPWLTTNAE